MAKTKPSTQNMMKKFRKNEFIFRNQELARNMYIIFSGSVTIPQEDNLEADGHNIGTGGILGDVAFLTGKPYTYSAQAREETLTLAINNENLIEIITTRPSLAYLIMKALATRLTKLGETLPLFTEEETAQEEEKTTEKQTKPLPKVENLFPDKHRKYFLSAPQQHEYFLYVKKVKCPVCLKTFPTRVVRTSRLNLKKVDLDFRNHYESFEPYWYSVWACPKCFHANIYQDFRKISPLLAKEIKKYTAAIQDNLELSFSEPFQLDDAFIHYYLALFCEQAKKDDSQKKGNLWLRLSWLYNDVQDKEMYNFATQKALECFLDIYIYFRDLTPQQDQKLALLIAELYIRQKDYNKAIQYLYQAINHKTGNPASNRQAQDRIQDLKKK